jgi:formate dehydrogenase beta subunit
MATSIEIPRTAGRRASHPGKGERRGRTTARGRQVHPDALAEIRALLADRPRRRDLLIEFLHLIQDRWGHISAQHVAALAEELRRPQAEIYEVATFYHHFDIVKEGEAAPPPVTVRVCDSLSCAMAGAYGLLAELREAVDPAAVRVVAAPCMGACSQAPAVMVGQRRVERATAAAVRSTVAAGDLSPAPIDHIGYEDYVAKGGYALYRRLAGLDPAGSAPGPAVALLEALNDSGLRGLGGAGFPTGRKWQIVKDQPGPRYLCVNADEGEPGTFKDGYYLRLDPHRFLEGVLIAAHAIEAAGVYIYLRDEYPAIRQVLLREIARLEAEGLASPGLIELRRGAGAYICGEESAMIESIEGKRGLPRHRPPYVAQVGLFGRPTLVNNVETLFWVRDIVEKGADWFARHGRNGGKGLRSYSVSGRVMDPGVKLAPAGITARELIDQFCGGMAPGHRLRAYLPGGASGGILPASMADLPLDFGKLEHLGCFVGSHAMVVLSDKDDLRGAVRNLMRFFEDESCGQCTPCRVGTEKAVRLMERPVWDTALLDELGRAMTDASICGLGQAAANPLKCLMKYFPEEFAPRSPEAATP